MMVHMEIIVVSGDRSVTVRVDGSSTELLREAEGTATRLLGSTPEAPAKPPIGFTAVVSEVEHANDDAA